jgi:diaminopimelate epimerase
MKKSSAVTLTRVSGAENTFLIADLFEPAAARMKSWTRPQKAAFAEKVCNDFFGFKTDGVLFLQPESGSDFSWDFFNSDGSAAEMCGNAARCATVYFHEFVEPKEKIRFQTLAGEIQGEFLSPHSARVTMTEITEMKSQLTLERVSGFYVNTGVPHFVLKSPPEKTLAQKLRFHPEFGEAGANITFVDVVSETAAKAVTFERGVEDFTQACGTGAVAAASMMASESKKDELFKIEMPGGLLEVERVKLHDRPLLTGPVRIEFRLDLLGE